MLRIRCTVLAAACVRPEQRGDREPGPSELPSGRSVTKTDRLKEMQRLLRGWRGGGGGGGAGEIGHPGQGEWCELRPSVGTCCEFGRTDHCQSAMWRRLGTTLWVMDTLRGPFQDTEVKGYGDSEKGPHRGGSR